MLSGVTRVGVLGLETGLGGVVVSVAGALDDSVFGSAVWARADAGVVVDSGIEAEVDSEMTFDCERVVVVDSATEVGSMAGIETAAAASGLGEVENTTAETAQRHPAKEEQGRRVMTGMGSKRRGTDGKHGQMRRRGQLAG